MMPQRIEYIDTAKGLCMIIVALTHITGYWETPTPVDLMLTAFHVPLFFFVSGMFFRPYNSLSEFTIKKVNTLLIPFLFFYLLTSVCMPNLLQSIGFEVRNTDNLDWFHCLTAAFVPSVRFFSNGPLWFLISLFIVNFYFYAITVFVRKLLTCNRLQGGAIGVLSLFLGGIGYWLSLTDIRFPLYADSALVAVPFFSAGYLLYHKTDILRETIPVWLWSLSAF